MYWDDYWQMYADGSGNYYNPDMTYAGFEDPETGEWFAAGGSAYEGNGAGNGAGDDTGAGGGDLTFGWDPANPDLTLPEWTPPADIDPGFVWQGPIQQLEEESGGLWDRAKKYCPQSARAPCPFSLISRFPGRVDPAAPAAGPR
jgi:hypothetical protein